MDYPEMALYLKERLTIEVEQEKGFYNERHTTIKIKLDEETISECSLDLDF